MDKVGGDFYDYTLREGFIDLFIADVSGHGLPGAFLAMMTKMSLESVNEREIHQPHPPPGKRRDMPLDREQQLRDRLPLLE